MFEIPEDRLPPGYTDTVEDPPASPVEARPAATVVLLRDTQAGSMEVLLMRRHRRSGFVPGAWVFPGGRVDPADAAVGLHERIRGLPDPARPEPAFWAAALRELFEETGVLMAREADGAWSPDAAGSAPHESLRQRLMEDELGLLDVVERLGVGPDARRMVHIAHWVTPVVERRRYDTHFFAAALPNGRTEMVDRREMTEAAWLEPAAALERFEAGTLPMVFPTVKTLEALAPFQTTDAVLDAFRERSVQRVLPRLVRTERGVAIVVDD